MNLILAGIPGGVWELREREIQNLHPKRLWSYFYIISETKIMERKNKVDLFLDSGAFSAWTQGVSIDIYEYIKFIKENEKLITVYANLDVIGDPVKTYENQKIMEESGLHPIPVFHAYYEDPIWLKKYIDEKHDYIALGGMAGGKISAASLQPVLDNLWQDYLTDEKGMPVCKVHGFGITGWRLMLRYPWYSVDSTSWVVTGRVGSIYVPRRKNGKWIYNENSWKIAVSNKSPNKKEAGQHFDTLPKPQQKIIEMYLDEKGYCIGKSSFKEEKQDYELQENERWFEKKPKDKSSMRKVEIIEKPGVSNMYQLRDEVNIIYFQDLEKSLPDWPWSFTIEKPSKLF